jgi:tail assembly chaperone
MRHQESEKKAAPGLVAADGFAASAARLAGLAGALLGWRPDDFWRATPAELAAVLGAMAAAARSVAGAGAGAAAGASAAAGAGAMASKGATASAKDLARLREMFPD